MPFMTDTQFNDMPPWLKQPYQEMIREAQAQSGVGVPPRAAGDAGPPLAHEYQPYPAGQRLAPIPADITAAHNLGRAQQGSYLPNLQQAEGLIGSSLDPFTSHVDQYMNPYQRHVVEQISKEGNQNFKKNIMPALEAKFVGLGQHGSSRHAKLSRRAARDTQKEILSRQQQALAHGYQQAAQLYNADMARRIEGAGQLGSLGGMRQAGLLSDIAMLENQGRYQQQQAQADKDVQYQEFLRQLEHPMHRLAFLSAIMHGVPTPTMSQTYQQVPTTPQMNLPGQLAGLAGNIWGTRMMANR